MYCGTADIVSSVCCLSTNVSKTVDRVVVGVGKTRADAALQSDTRATNYLYLATMTFARPKLKREENVGFSVHIPSIARGATNLLASWQREGLSSQTSQALHEVVGSA